MWSSPITHDDFIEGHEDSSVGFTGENKTRIIFKFSLLAAHEQ